MVSIRTVALFTVAVVAAANTSSALAQSVLGNDRAWRWNASFTPASDPALRASYSRIMETSVDINSACVPVENLIFEAPQFTARLISGRIWSERPVEGYPAGAWFEGSASIDFDAPQRNTRASLRNAFGTDSLQHVAVGWLYILTLRDGVPVARQIGATSSRIEPTPAPVDAYARAKATLRQAGLPVVDAFLNRDGRSKNTVWVLFAPDWVRSGGNGDAALLYSYDPAAKRPVELSVFGHSAAFPDHRVKRALEAYPEYKYTFYPVAWTRREGGDAWTPPVDVAKYDLSLTFSPSLSETSEIAVVEFTPSAGVSSLALSLTNRLAVTSVEGPGGEPYPFVQWGFLTEHPEFDQTLLVRLPPSLVAGKPTSLKVVSKGPLFDPSSFADALADEDTWYPYAEDRDGALFETSGTTSRELRFVASGRQVSDVLTGRERTVRYATTRPAFGSTFYVGEYEKKEAKAEDGTRIEVFVDRNTHAGGDSTGAEYAAQEIASAIGTFDKILDAPLDSESLRAVATPTRHGRGFEGLLLLAGGGVLNQSEGDVFRAHEVAHQWWGNMVTPDAWPEDRWLEESTAEYLAMEFYQRRFRKPEKTRERMRERWVWPLRRATRTVVSNLAGQERHVDAAEIHALVDGSQNVCTKGPLILHQLRYLFRVMKNDDEGFWIVLQDFLAKNKYKRAGTSDFIALAEQQLGGAIDWYWDQWVYGTKIPTVSWFQKLAQDPDGTWRLEVRGTQADTDYQMAIPVYVTLKDGSTMTVPLVFAGKEGMASARMEHKPSRISLNDNYEALVWLKN